jgi:hypothetical protein
MLPSENEDLYFQRLLIDMKKGLVWDVFSSLQSTFPEFREKLIPKCPFSQAKCKGILPLLSPLLTLFLSTSMKKEA